jgi:hypothetical protein
MSSDSGNEFDRDYRFDVSVVIGSEPYNGGKMDWLNPQRWSAMLTAYWARRFAQRGWGQWIGAVDTQWPVTFTHKSPLLRKTNDTHAYDFGREFSVGVDAPNWIQARKYVDACLKPVLAEKCIIHPPEQQEGISKISEELSQLTGNFQSAGQRYEPLYPEIQFGASGRDETIGIVRLDVADSQIEAIVSQAREVVQNENPGLFSPCIPIQSESAGEQLNEAVKMIREGEDVFASVDLTSDEEDSDPPTTSLVFVVSESGARRLGNAIETVNERESESADTTTALVHPELVKAHTEQLVKLASAALETSGRGVVGSIPDNDDVPIDLDWVRTHSPPDPSIEVLGFRAEFGEEEEIEEDSTGEPVIMSDKNEPADQEEGEQDDGKVGNNEQEDNERGGGEQEETQEKNGQLDQSQYRISIELAADKILSKQFDASYADDVPANNLESEEGGLHIPNPEICLFIDVALDSSGEEALRESLDDIDITGETAEIAVLKGPVEHESVHQELIIEAFPHFNLIDLRDDLRSLIEDAGGEVRTEELPYFAKYSTEEPYYITHDISSLTNPERELTDSEDYYNERRIELIQSQTDYRSTVSAEKMSLALSEVKTGDG